MVPLLLKKPITDQWIHSELNLPQGELLRRTKVVAITKDGIGDVTGSDNHNPFLNGLTHDVDFCDGEIKEYFTNVIGENVFASRRKWV